MPSVTVRIKFLVALFLIVFGSSNTASARARASLVVLIVVDAFPTRYLNAHKDLLKRGIGRLQRQGATYLHGMYAYSSTETCPGHATLITGVWPDTHGVVANHWFQDGTPMTCVRDPKHGKSPRFLMVPTLSDELRLASRGASKTVSISNKARAAIMLAGHHPTMVAWYDASIGRYVTGSWYEGGGKKAPKWFVDLSLKQTASAAHGQKWDRFRADLDYAELSSADSWPHESDLPGLGRTFPRVLGAGLGGLDPKWLSVYRTTPPATESLVSIAKRAITEERLGQRGVVDLLAVSFSAVDYAGHWWGPDSQEAFDLLLRIDHAIGQLIDHIDETVGSGNTLYVVTGDHGMLPTPEIAKQKGVLTGRIDPRPLIAAGTKALRGTGLALLELNTPRVYLSLPAPEKKTQDRTAIARRVAAAMDAASEDILQAVALADLDRLHEPYRTLYARSLFQGRNPDLLLFHRPQFLIDEVGAIGIASSHGSAFHYDMSVPIIIQGPGVRRGEDRRPYDMTQVAPTIAALLAIDPPAAAYDPPLPAAGY